MIQEKNLELFVVKEYLNGFFNLLGCNTILTEIEMKPMPMKIYIDAGVSVIPIPIRKSHSLTKHHESKVC